MCSYFAHSVWNKKTPHFSWIKSTLPSRSASCTPVWREVCRKIPHFCESERNGKSGSPQRSPSHPQLCCPTMVKSQRKAKSSTGKRRLKQTLQVTTNELEHSPIIVHYVQCVHACTSGTVFSPLDPVHRLFLRPLPHSRKKCAIKTAHL